MLASIESFSIGLSNSERLQGEVNAFTRLFF